MPNTTGKNQLSPHGYGDVQRQTQLKRSAPISGAPQVAPALNTPQRSQRRATRQAQPQEQPAQEMPGPAPTPQAQVGAIWQQLAAMPGASDLVKAQAA